MFSEKIIFKNIKKSFKNSWSFFSWKKFQFFFGLSILFIVIFSALLAPLLPIDQDEMRFDLNEWTQDAATECPCLDAATSLLSPTSFCQL